VRGAGRRGALSVLGTSGMIVMTHVVGARFVFQDGSNVTGHRRAAGPGGRDPAVELGDTKQSDFFLICCFEREHKPLSCPRD
jgi:hypothetical protein